MWMQYLWRPEEGIKYPRPEEVMQVLGIEPWSSASIVSAMNHWAVFPAPKAILFLNFIPFDTLSYSLCTKIAKQ